MKEVPYRPHDNILINSELVDMTEQDGEVILSLKKNNRIHTLSFMVVTERGVNSTRSEGEVPSYGRMCVKLNGKYLSYGIVGLESELNKGL